MRTQFAGGLASGTDTLIASPTLVYASEWVRLARHSHARVSLSNSPWMRGAPHSGLAAAIFLIKARISGMASGRPLHFPLEIQVQKSRKPLRCQDTTVSGLTMIKARRQC